MVASFGSGRYAMKAVLFYLTLGTLAIIQFPTLGACQESPPPEQVKEHGPLTTHTLGSKFADDTGIELRGWVAGGVTFNNEAGNNNFNGPVSFNDRDGELQANQVYFVMERVIDKTSDELSVGGRVDVLYGSDAVFTQALGLDADIVSNSVSRYYKLAIPQAYVESTVPGISGLTVKAGHFYTLLGYETVTAPDNFFYSHAYTMQYGEPFTHTGALATYALSSTVTVAAGITEGWDNFSRSGKGRSFLGSAAWSEDGTSVTAAITSGNEAPGANRTVYSTVVSRSFCEKWKYTLQHDWGYNEGSDSGGQTAHWYGVNQYLS